MDKKVSLLTIIVIFLFIPSTVLTEEILTNETVVFMVTANQDFF